jgi:hypothetical protein
VLALGLACIVTSVSVGASTLVQQQLQGINSVVVTAYASRDLGEARADAIALSLKRRVEAKLANAGFRRANARSPVVSVTVDAVSYCASSRRIIALRFEVKDEVSLRRKRATHQIVWATIWTERDILEVEDSVLEERLTSSIDNLIGIFLDDLRRANQNAQR